MNTAERPRLPARRPRVWTTWFVALAIFVAAPLAHAQGKVAVIDLRRAVADTEDGLRVQSKLQQLFDSRQTEYDAKEKAYTEAKNDLEKVAKDGKTAEAEVRKKYATVEKMAIDLRATQYNYRTEMQRQENELMYPIIKHMLTLVRRLSAQSGYDMVLSKDAVPYYRADLDITDRIIQMYNSSQGSEETPSGKGNDGSKKGTPKTGAPGKDGSSKAPGKDVPSKDAPSKDAPSKDATAKDAKPKSKRAPDAQPKP